MKIIGIISAIKHEIKALLDNLEDVKILNKGNRNYYSGKLYNTSVVLVFSRWGKVASATTATQLINDFKVDEILFTGVAGAIKKNYKIGDIIIGEKLFQDDMDARPIFPKYMMPLINKKYFETDSIKTNQLKIAAFNFINSTSYQELANDLEKFEINSIKISKGDIASGDQFISNSNSVKILNKELPTVCCVEMEGAAVAQVCFEYEIPFIIMRTISDNANNNSHIDFPKFTKQIASKIALGVIKEYFKTKNVNYANNKKQQL